MKVNAVDMHAYVDKHGYGETTGATDKMRKLGSQSKVQANWEYPTDASVIVQICTWCLCTASHAEIENVLDIRMYIARVVCGFYNKIVGRQTD